MGTTYIGVCLAWVLFRAPSLGDAGSLLRAMLLGRGGGGVALSDLERASVLLVTVGLLAVHAASRETDFEGFLARIPWWLRAPALATLVLGLAVAPGENRAFIYFQF
jgi:alginate O-acetyltransferase complex protein AlgI